MSSIRIERGRYTKPHPKPDDEGIAWYVEQVTSKMKIISHATVRDIKIFDQTLFDT